MHKYRVPIKTIQWPGKCASCFKPAHKVVYAKCSVVKKLGFSFLRMSPTHSSDVVVVPYPVCGRHKITATILSKLGARNLFNLGLGFLAVFLFFSYMVHCITYLLNYAPELNENYNLLDPTTMFFGLGYPAAYLVLYVLVRRSVPVIIYEFDGRRVVLSIKNDRFRQEFVYLNSTFKM